MSLTVMVVDDSMIMTQKLSVMLRELGHRVVSVCRDGSEAMRDYPLVKPDLVTMDITMPGMDGIDTMTGIMATNPDARVIMVTSHGQEAMVLRALEAGALGYVLKPVTKERLAAMIERSGTHTRSKNPDSLNRQPTAKPADVRAQDADRVIVET
jgi:two-component system chemotaxis response regulator CheY